MARRIDLTGAGGLRLAAWEFADPPKPAGQAGSPGPDDGGAESPWPGGGAGPERGGEPGVGPTAKGPGVLLLHGLLGRASHWAETARGLAGDCRAVALDQRGHGLSEHPAGTAGLTPEAFVADAAAALEQLSLGPAVVVGHGMGALVGWRLAAERPDLVRGLVLAEMKASALGAALQREWEDWLAAWPTPFATLEDVREWFSRDPWVERPSRARASYYAEVMTQAPDGWRPVFDPEQMRQVRRGWAFDAHWEELAQVPCPTLVVRGVDGHLGRAEAHEMVRVLPRGEYAEIPDAGHLLHHDQPTAWREVLTPFLQGVLTP
ncbi:alpha/beta hydrolase [Streptomyces sp. NPDC005012]|uniref:alpha/beta fold hydrolase n=1 Tax=Streptomyces sp. NPDC005012 TaxID=3154558 RepID=UPI0033B20F9E